MRRPRVYRGKAGAGVSGPTGIWPGRGGIGGSQVRVGAFSPGWSCGRAGVAAGDG